MITKGRFYTVLFCVSLLLFIAWGGIRIKAAIEFDSEVRGYFRNYLEAGTIEGAKDNLEAAIEGLESRGLTEGQISIFLKNPNNNIELWYNNLLESRDALKKAASEETAFNQAIILEKQKDGLKGRSNNTAVKHPDGISIYPFNQFYFWWSILSLAGIIGFGIRMLVLSEHNEWETPLIKVKDNRAKA